MDTSCQTDLNIESSFTKKKFKFCSHLQEKPPHSQSPTVELPSIRRHKNFFNLSNGSESPRGRANNIPLPIKFPSIFKKYKNHLNN